MFVQCFLQVSMICACLADVLLLPCYFLWYLLQCVQFFFYGWCSFLHPVHDSNQKFISQPSLSPAQYSLTVQNCGLKPFISFLSVQIFCLLNVWWSGWCVCVCMSVFTFLCHIEQAMDNMRFCNSVFIVSIFKCCDHCYHYSRLSKQLWVGCVWECAICKCPGYTVHSVIVMVSDRGRLWYSGRALDCWSTGQIINPAPRAWFITKFILTRIDLV